MTPIPSPARSLALALLFGACSTPPAEVVVPPPPRLSPAVVDVGGRAVEIVEAGAGDVTVVFESGFGNDWSAWRRVATV